jgi:hypothetical protein
VGAGIYFLASSITSFLHMHKLTLKFWFFVLTQNDILTNRYVVRGECIAIEPALKVTLYLDRLLNGCVAIERAIAVAKGVKFDKQWSQNAAR